MFPLMLCENLRINDHSDVVCQVVQNKLYFLLIAIDDGFICDFLFAQSNLVRQDVIKIFLKLAKLMEPPTSSERKDYRPVMIFDQMYIPMHSA